jgi:hypothetical protein
MVKCCGLSQSMGSCGRRTSASGPYRTECFKLSKDPRFIEKLRNIVPLYHNPPDPALILCVDEKSADGPQPTSVPMPPGQAERRTPAISPPWNYHRFDLNPAQLSERTGASACPLLTHRTRTQASCPVLGQQTEELLAEFGFCSPQSHRLRERKNHQPIARESTAVI